jgi:hypothetical protein
MFANLCFDSLVREGPGSSLSNEDKRRAFLFNFARRKVALEHVSSKFSCFIGHCKSFITNTMNLALTRSQSWTWSACLDLKTKEKQMLRYYFTE